MGSEAAATAFESGRISPEAFAHHPAAILASDRLVARVGGRYYPWTAAAPRLVGMLAFGSVIPHVGPDLDGAIKVEKPPPPLPVGKREMVVAGKGGGHGSCGRLGWLLGASRGCSWGWGWGVFPQR